MAHLLSHIIDRSARSFPDRPAFRFYNDTVTYSQLHSRARQLAGVLKSEGVDRGDRVGIFMNKCLEMPIAVYGILMAGAAYVPIDPAAPPQRLEFIIRNCGIRVLISQKSKARMISQIKDKTALDCLIGLDDNSLTGVRSITWSSVYSASDTSTVVGPATEQDLAYIMYTSGSTGEPKGIMHTHHSGLSYARLSAETYGIRKNDILGNHSPLHFDMSTFEFFSGPLKGACTVLIPEEYTRLPASLSKLMADEKMTFWYSVPFALIQLLLRGALAERDLSALRWVLFGGEPFPSKHLRALMTLWPAARFSNVYGPAEVNQCAYYHVPSPPKEDDDPVPIGRMWDNSQGLVVDEQDQSVAMGETGELLVRSPTMMHGYWNRDDLNQRAFYRRNPFPGFTETFYRTGDLVKMNPDGNCQYIGRKDRQIKTRGYRVELDEIEVALLTHELVEEAAAYAVSDTEGSVLIGAGITLKDHAGVSEAELLNHLKTRLPPYALPRQIRIVPAFKRTATGKIDRNALKGVNTIGHHA